MANKGDTMCPICKHMHPLGGKHIWDGNTEKVQIETQEESEGLTQENKPDTVPVPAIILEKEIKAGRGRKRFYESNADRQRAYRERKKIAKKGN